MNMFEYWLHTMMLWKFTSKRMKLWMKAGVWRCWEPIQVVLPEIKSSLEQILNRNDCVSKPFSPENATDWKAAVTEVEGVVLCGMKQKSFLPLIVSMPLTAQNMPHRIKWRWRVCHPYSAPPAHFIVHLPILVTFPQVGRTFTFQVICSCHLFPALEFSLPFFYLENIYYSQISHNSGIWVVKNCKSGEINKTTYFDCWNWDRISKVWTWKHVWYIVCTQEILIS